MTKAFAFDIDGVLVRGGRVLPEAKQALQLLNRRRVPWILLTNGGGTHEKKRVADLSQRLDVPISQEQFLQSHTPFKDFVGKNDRVLVVGGKPESCREIALDYGFKDVVVPLDIVAKLPHIHPFPSLTSSLVGHKRIVDFDPAKPFDSVFVFQDSYDMSVDSQIVIDLLLSQNGVLGTRKEPSQFAAKPSIPIHFSNADLEWATDYTLPRFGQGAFIATIKALYKAKTGQDLTHTVIGKPTILTYNYANKLLQNWAKQRGEQIDSVYMIGDNQHSDILGANEFGWQSVLVRSGVYKDGDKLFTKPTYIRDNVLAAVETALALDAA